MLKYIKEIPEKLQGAVGRSAFGPSLAALGAHVHGQWKNFN